MSDFTQLWSVLLINQHLFAIFYSFTILESGLLRGNWRDSWIFMLYLGLIPFNTTYRTYLRIKNCEKNGGSRDLFYCYWPWREGTLAFSLASVGAQIRLFYAKRKIKSGFKLWNRLEYTLRSISWRNEAFTI